ncbi:hypothetical protein LWF15_12030 [Kineosporia rhizophila]|uniref:hypothetical protein n=1 Tax=Kineosporia TaxID=49184 RepID=UPI001E3AA044|nr:hypothetical protein [Kineosporia sp. NBRC 101677]MCE0536236.1 hypothetical protein [Kineosporia rhizophila]
MSGRVPRRGLLGLPGLQTRARGRADHFYTTNLAEKRAAMARGYRDETGTTAPMYVFDRGLLHAGIRAVPLHRLYSAERQDHLYTTDEAEVRRSIRGLGYTDELRLDSLWVFPGGDTPDSTRLFRLWHPHLTDHFYTTSEAEADHAVQRLGYRRRPFHPLPEPDVLKMPALAEGITAVRLHRLYRP